MYCFCSFIRGITFRLSNLHLLEGVIKMNLSKTERLMLINQFSIMEKLEDDEKERYSLYKEILERGYVYDYDEIFDHLYKDLPVDNSKFVINVLSMYRSLNDSYLNLEVKDSVDVSRLKFRGFDGNEEASYMSYAKFVLHTLGRFDELKDDSKLPDYNTHSRRIGKYAKMLSVWRELKDNYEGKLSADDINRVLNA